MSVGIARIGRRAAASSRERRDGRARLLDGARQLLAEKGYAGMELRDVAERGKRPARLDLPPLPRRQGPARAPRRRELEGARDPRADRALAGRARAAGDAGDVRRDLPPPRRRPPRADRLPGRRGRPGPPRGPGARRRGHRRLPELGTRRSRPPCEREGVEPAPAAEPSPASSSRRSRAPSLRARAAGDQAPLDSAIAGLEQALDSLLASAALRPSAQAGAVLAPAGTLPAGRQSACASRPSNQRGKRALSL